MATRCFISKLQADGSVRGIYCHHDGYRSGVGLTLEKCYMDPEKVDQLLALGDISSLGADIGKKHAFDQAWRANRDLTTAYHRDRGEAFKENRVYPDVKVAVESTFHEMGAEFVYVFQYDGWRLYETTE